MNAAVNGFTYNAAGNMTYAGNSYLYDGEGRICAVASPSGLGGIMLTGYFYDTMGTRVAKGSLTSFSCNFASNGFMPTTSYVLGLKGEQITELSVTGAAGSYVSAWKHANVFDALGLQATYSQTGAAAAPTSTYFALNDWLGTKRAEVGSIVGSNGAAQPCVATFASLPYGDGLTPSGNCPDATEHHFTGKERDTESGNDYFGARYYASSMGRWMSPDWSSSPEAVPYAEPSNPQSLNLYNYVLNNPLSHTDPDGHECTVDGEHHGGLWCFAHNFGFVTTKKEDQDWNDQQAAIWQRAKNNYESNHPGRSFENDYSLAFVFVPGGEGVEGAELLASGAGKAASILKIVEQDGDAIHAVIQTAKGPIEVMANMTKEGDKLVLDGVHVGEGVKLTNGEIRAAAQELGRQQGVSTVEVRGGVRTAGAIAGQAPQPFTVKVN